MSIDNARRFIRRALEEHDLRRRLNLAEGAAGRGEALAAAGLDFNCGEFEEAFNNLLCSCQHEEQAAQLRELRLWWDFLQTV